MAHRGPDGAGLWRGQQVVLGHRRLAVIDVSDAGRQPMATPDGRFVIVYNGELYNDAAIRRELAREGVEFRSECDTETVLWALAWWGVAGLARLRGMYALGLHDVRERRLLLARDPLGVKPLFWWQGRARDGAGSHDELVFASEIPAVLGHPAVGEAPDPVAISAYLTTIRRTLGERTLFADARTLEPGCALDVDLSRESISMERIRHWPARAEGPDGGAERVREVVSDSVLAHLRSDVPTCCLLSGGLDSTIITSVACREHPAMRTYCAGAPSETDDDDLSQARRVAGLLRTRHEEALLTGDGFRARWRELVGRMRQPLSTPNEVAIFEVASRLRRDGCIVTLSGEGADELFGGYEHPLRQALQFVESDGGDPGLFQLESAAWISPGAKPGVLRPEAWRRAGEDAELRAWYGDEFARLALQRSSGEPLQAHLRFHRRVNLAGLLDRLDTATMLASVEGRTPFADRVVADLAESLPMADKFAIDPDSRARTKWALRSAFAGVLPSFVVGREKASFPIPFQTWAGELANLVRSSELCREWFSDAALEAVGRDPAGLWPWTWPMANLALWVQGGRHA